MKSVVYIGAFLTEESRAILLAAVPPLHFDVYAGHVTIVFRPEPEDLILFADGREVELEVFEEVWDARGQAVAVRGVPSENAHPHITISTTPETKPVYSNELLSLMPKPPESLTRLPFYRKKIDPSLKLTAVLDTFPRKHPRPVVVAQTKRGASNV